MTSPYRAMCAELAEELVNEYGYCTEWEKGLPLCESNVSELLTRARALLDQPEPEVPTDAALIKMWATASYIDQPEGGLAFARAVLARYGGSTSNSTEY